MKVTDDISRATLECEWVNVNEISSHKCVIQVYNTACAITGNMHIEYRCAGDATLCCRCASCHSLSPENAIYLAGTGRASPYLYGSNAVSCGSVGGVLTQE